MLVDCPRQHTGTTVCLPGEWRLPNTWASPLAVPSGPWSDLEGPYAQFCLQSSRRNPQEHCPGVRSRPVQEQQQQQQPVTCHYKTRTGCQETHKQTDKQTLSYRWILEVKYFSKTLIFSTLGELSMKPAHKKYIYIYPRQAHNGHGRSHIIKTMDCFCLAACLITMWHTANITHSITFSREVEFPSFVRTQDIQCGLTLAWEGRQAVQIGDHNTSRLSFSGPTILWLHQMVGGHEKLIHCVICLFFHYDF